MANAIIDIQNVLSDLVCNQGPRLLHEVSLSSDDIELIRQAALVNHHLLIALQESEKMKGFTRAS